MAWSGTRNIAIVGGGLVGSLVSVFLSRRGWNATVYERLADIRESSESAGRSINLVLTSRGIDALDRVGLKAEALRLSVPVLGRMMHSIAGELAYQPYGRDDSECNYSISRKGLNEFLLDSAERHGVRVRFGAVLNEVDLDRGRLRFSGGSSGSLAVDAETIIGADGGGSALRQQLSTRAGFRDTSQLLEHGYKELTIPAEQGRNLEQHALHIWPRGNLMLMALPNLDGSFTVTLYLPLRGPASFESLDTPAAVLRLFETQFPDSIPLIPGLLRDYAENPSGILGTVRFEPWNYRDRALLIGDAAHAIVPFFGQGMNSGFEDCTVLDGLLDRYGDGELETVFDRFSRERKPDADAIADMALENFVEMRDRVGDAAFLLRKQVEHLLEQRMPQRYRSRYSMVMYSSIPYRIAYEAGAVQQRILDELCDGLSSAADCDLERARRLIDEKLTPLLVRRGVNLDY